MQEPHTGRLVLQGVEPGGRIVLGAHKTGDLARRAEENSSEEPGI